MSANGTTELVATPSAGTAVRVGFGERSITAQAETSATAVAAQQTAMVQAGFIMAERKPRNFDQVRFKLMQACKRPRFAEAGMFRKPVGKEKNEETGEWQEKIAEGLSIRFAEEAARNMGNLRIDSYTVYDDPKKKIVKFVVLDLESNTEWSKTVTLEKTTEKKQLKKNQMALATRTNSYGELVYVVEATQEEMTKREGAESSKGWRDGILKNLPADIKEECLDEIRKTISNETAQDPAAAKKRVLDGFAGLNVSPAQLSEYIGHDLDTLSPKEIDELRAIFVSVRDGETTWAAVMDQRSELAAEKAKRAEKTPAGAKPASADAAVKAAREKREKAEKEAKEKAAGATTAAAQSAASQAAPAGATATASTTAADPGAAISPGPGKAAAPEPAKAEPPAAEFQMSTSKQRTQIAKDLTAANMGLHEVNERYNVQSFGELSHAQAEDALTWIRSITGEVAEPGSEG